MAHGQPWPMVDQSGFFPKMVLKTNSVVICHTKSCPERVANPTRYLSRVCFDTIGNAAFRNCLPQRLQTFLLCAHLVVQPLAALRIRPNGSKQHSCSEVSLPYLHGIQSDCLEGIHCLLRHGLGCGRAWLRGLLCKKALPQALRIAGIRLLR